MTTINKSTKQGVTFGLIAVAIVGTIQLMIILLQQLPH